MKIPYVWKYGEFYIFSVFIKKCVYYKYAYYRDLDPAESMKEKMGKIFEVKGVKGLRKLMKEIAVTASTGKHDNELIGKAHIPLKVSYSVSFIILRIVNYLSLLLFKSLIIRKIKQYKFSLLW